MAGDGCGGFEAALAQRLLLAADAGAVASLAVAAWRDIDAGLSPVIGSGGTAALFQRSAHLTAARHRWIATLGTGVQTVIDYAAFEQLLPQQAGAEAAAAASHQAHALCELLTSLVGPTLTDRLLRFARARLEAGTSPQDTSP